MICGGGGGGGGEDFSNVLDSNKFRKKLVSKTLKYMSTLLSVDLKALLSTWYPVCAH